MLLVKLNLSVIIIAYKAILVNTFLSRGNIMLHLSKQKILIILADRSMSTKQLAELVGMKPNNMSALLSRRNCSPITAGNLARALNVSVSEIVED